MFAASMRRSVRFGARPRTDPIRPVRRFLLVYSAAAVQTKEISSKSSDSDHDAEEDEEDSPI